MLPSNYKCRTADDFVGAAHRIAHDLVRYISGAQKTGDPFALLFLGKPGVGKSELSNFAASLCGSNKWESHRFNGTQLNIQAMEALAMQLQSRPLFGGFRVIQIEEVDKVPHVAQVRMLTLLDDKPSHTAFLATSNCDIRELEERFQRRFTLFKVPPPREDDVLAVLRKVGVSEAHAREIAFKCGGNLGAALHDADVALLLNP